MAWSTRAWFVALFAALQLGFMGCAPSFPRVPARANHAFMNKSRPVQTVDILPLDVQLWTYPGNSVHPQVLGDSFHALSAGAVLAELSSRGYDVVAHMDWDGSYDTRDGQRTRAMTPDEVDGTVYALSTYGRAIGQSGNQAGDDLLPPYLPYVLGQRTGSDATLYVGGWSYVGENGDSTGVKVAKGVAIGLIVLAAAAVIIILVAGKGKGGSGLGRVASGAGRAAGSAGKAAAKLAVTVGRTAGRVTGTVLRGVARSGPDIIRGVGRTADAFGRSGTHIEISNGRPNYYQEDRAPKKGRSQMYLEMTLIDNATGDVLWHARQQFPADGSKSEHVRKAIAHMLESLPAY